MFSYRRQKGVDWQKLNYMVNNVSSKIHDMVEKILVLTPIDEFIAHAEGRILLRSKRDMSHFLFINLCRKKGHSFIIAYEAYKIPYFRMISEEKLKNVSPKEIKHFEELVNDCNKKWEVIAPLTITDSNYLRSVLNDFILNNQSEKDEDIHTCT